MRFSLPRACPVDAMRLCESWLMGCPVEVCAWLAPVQGGAFGGVRLATSSPPPVHGTPKDGLTLDLFPRVEQVRLWTLYLPNMEHVRV